MKAYQRSDKFCNRPGIESWILISKASIHSAHNRTSWSHQWWLIRIGNMPKLQRYAGRVVPSACCYIVMLILTAVPNWKATWLHFIEQVPVGREFKSMLLDVELLTLRNLDMGFFSHPFTCFLRSTWHFCTCPCAILSSSAHSVIVCYIM